MLCFSTLEMHINERIPRVFIGPNHFGRHSDLCVIYVADPKTKTNPANLDHPATPYMLITSLADNQRSNERDPYHKMLSTHVHFPRQLSVSRATSVTLDKIIFFQIVCDVDNIKWYTNLSVGTLYRFFHKRYSSKILFF